MIFLDIYIIKYSKGHDFFFLNANRERVKKKNTSKGSNKNIHRKCIFSHKYLLFICRCRFLFLFLLSGICCNISDILLRLPWFHLLFWLRRHGCGWLFLLLGQVEGRQVVAAQFGLYVSVVKQEPLLLLVLRDFAVDPHGPKPSPGQRSRVLQALEHVPRRNLLLSRHLKTLYVRNHSAKVSEWPEAEQRYNTDKMLRTSFSKPAILLPFVSMSDPWGSQVITSRVCLGRGSNWRTFSKLSD